MPHQIVGADFLAARQYAMLADEPGAGKTAQVIEAAALIGAANILVLCPTSVRHHWAREFMIVSNRRDITVVEGLPKRIRGGITITGHSAMAKAEPVALLTSAAWDLVVVDESHEFRSITANRTVYLLGATPKALWHHVKRMWLLTGSPVVNSAADIYPACASVFSGGRLIPYTEFIYRYTDVIPDPWAGERPTGIKNEHELKSWLQPWMLRRADFLNLPPRTVRSVPLDVEDDDLAPVIAMLRNLSEAQIEEMIEFGIGPDESLSRVRRALGIAKAEAAAQYIGWLVVNGHGPIVAFYHHQDVREILYSTLRMCQMRISWIDGAVSGDQRLAAVDWFQGGRLDLLLVQTQAGGTGITLTQSNRAVVVESPWTAVALEQAIARLHRITQRRAVTADILTSDCWLDEAIARIVVKKANTAKRLLT